MKGATRAAKKLSKDKARPISLELLRALLPEVWALMRPRRGVLALAFVLMAREPCGGPRAAPLDPLLHRRRDRPRPVEWLVPLVLGVLGATAVQGLSSYALVQLVSKAAQKLIAEMRIKVQEHVGRLPIAFHDRTRSGDLVSRIMNDVEGVRNLIGTGLVELFGGLVTASLAFGLMLQLSASGHAADARGGRGLRARRVPGREAARARSSASAARSTRR